VDRHDGVLRVVLVEPLGGPREQAAVGVAAEDVEDSDVGQGARRDSRLRSLRSRPSSCSSRSMSFSQTRSPAFSENALAISRLPARSGFSVM
jgi:hypothetical protein